MKHLDEETLMALVDGGVPPNEEPPMREHLAGCATCREELASIETLVGDLATDDEPGDVDAHVGKVMEIVAARPNAEPKPRQLSTAITAVVAIAAAAAVLVALTWHHEKAPPEMAARGIASARSPLLRNVGVRLYVGDSKPVALRDGDEVTPETVYAGAHNNIGNAPAHVMVFAIDSAKAIHWLYPAYVETGTDPVSVLVPQSEEEQGFPTSVVLSAPALGSMRIVTLITNEPRRVSEIERRSLDALERDALEKDLGGAVTVKTVRVRSGP